MIRTFVSEPAALASLALVLGIVAVWAHLLAVLSSV
jgi:hypothetical protein